MPLTTEPDALPAVVVRETGTGPFRHLVVDVPAGVHPATLAAALRSLPIACEFETMEDLAGTRGGGELRFRVHDEHPRLTNRPGGRVLRLADDSPFAEYLGACGEGEER
ncbi:hypothetical protein [Parafrankia sp. FMc2]|uniref:hypothetical protein n=1 Tax=Parafrankia sp. FMc2 TaxID=3233196 RepID=UPI0034D447DF